MPRPWDKKRIDEAKKALRASATVVEAARKLGIAPNALSNAMRNEGIVPSALTKEPDRHPIEIATEREAAKGAKDAVKALVEELRAEKAKNEFLQALGKPRKSLKIERRERASGLREMTALVLASDWHVEEEVLPAKVQGRNKYTLEIADLRMQRFWDGIIELVWHHRASKSIAIRDMILWLGGDLMTGHIHEEMLMTSQLTPIEVILWLTPRLKAGIEYVVNELDLQHLVIPCDIGNHGRTTKFRNIATGPETSYEYGMYVQLSREFAKDKRIEFDTTPSNDHYVKAYDYTLHTTHGDSLRYAGGVGGLTIPALKAASSWDTDIYSDCHAFGHFHTALDIDKVVGNGSMIGWAPFAKFIKARYNERDLSQHFSLIDKSRGRCHSTNIWVSNRKEELKFWTPAERAMIREDER